ncbi:MAG: outer membrane protein assembly factor BamA [Myxococcota bacterium]
MRVPSSIEGSLRFIIAAFVMTGWGLIPNSALGQSIEALEGRPVERLAFEGLLRVEPAAVELVLTTRVGEAFRVEAVAEDVRAIYGMGFFEDVQVFARPTSGQGVLLSYVVEEKPAIRNTRIVGNSRVSTEDIKEVIDIRPFTILNQTRVQRNVQKVRDLYNEKGFFLAEVDSRIESVSGGQVDVVIEVREAAKVQVRSIKFVGNRAFDDETLKGGIETREGDLLSFLTEAGKYRQDAFQIDILRITSRYFDDGYVNVRVDPPDIEISPDRRFIYITIRIEEGEQYTVGDVGFTGDLVEPPEVLERLLATQEGQIFSRSRLSDDLLGLKTRYENYGYAYANITPQTAVNPKDRTISLTFDIDRGQRVYYERINILGNTKTRDKVIRRELRIFEGELTSATRRELSKRRVEALGYFETVELRTRRGSTDGYQVVDVEVKERATGTFQVGAGFSSIENFIFTAQIAQQNFLGNGQSFQLSASLSSVRQLFNLRFVEPYFLDTEWSLSLNAFNTDLQFSNFNREARGGEILFGHPINFISEFLRFSAGYRIEFVDSSDAFGTSIPLFAPLNNSGRISLIRTILSYDIRDNRLFPTRGMFHTLSFDVSSTALGATSNRSFQRLRLFARFYHPIVWKFIGRLQVRVGWLNPDSETQFAPSENFILGGIQSIRGYSPLSIGPERQAFPNNSGTGDVDPTARDFVFIEGGNKEFLANFEIEFPIVESVNIRGVFFVDAGNVFGTDENFFYINDRIRGSARGPDDPLFFDFGSLPLGLFWSAGFGARWFSPIGPLRFEWGFPLTPRPIDTQSPLFEFSIGNSF